MNCGHKEAICIIGNFWICKVCDNRDSAAAAHAAALAILAAADIFIEMYPAEGPTPKILIERQKFSRHEGL